MTTSFIKFSELTNGDELQLDNDIIPIVRNNINYKVIPQKASQQQVFDADTLTPNAIVTSDLMNFQQQGAGAVLYPLVSKMQQTLSVEDFGAVGDGVTDDTTAIQNAINAASNVNFENGKTYKITNALTLHSNLMINGSGATILTDYLPQWLGQVFNNAMPLMNVTLFGLNILGNGTWTSTPFPNPNGGGDSVGFTNRLRVIRLTGCTNVNIVNNQFSGVSDCINLIDAVNCNVSNNIATGIGQVGVRLDNYTNCIIQNNYVNGVLGNMTNAGDTNIANSKFADGVLIQDGNSCNINNNNIQDCIRIGIVVEGSTTAITNYNVAVNNNIIKNMNSSRGTEFNAGVWVEPYKSINVVISDNVLDNTGVITAGTLKPNGIWAVNATITGNTITYFQQGINAYEGCVVSNNQVSNALVAGIVASFNNGLLPTNVDNNTLNNCVTSIQIPPCSVPVFAKITSNIVINGGAILCVSTLAGSSVSILDNVVKDSTTYGIQINASKGKFTIKGNTLENCATSTITSSPDYNKTAIIVNNTYNDQYLDISDNTFISYQATGSTSGQLFGVVYVGAIYTQTTEAIKNNRFIFTNVAQSEYPTSLNVRPTCFGQSNGNPTPGIMGTIGDFINIRNNECSKSPNIGWGINGASGEQRLIGSASTYPTSGSYAVGDIVNNSATTLSSPTGWICINATGSGTWRPIGGQSSKIQSGVYNSTIGLLNVVGTTDYNGRTTTITITTPILNSSFSTTLSLNPSNIATSLGLTPAIAYMSLIQPGAIANRLSSGALSAEDYIFVSTGLTPTVWTINLSGSLTDSARNVAFTFTITGGF